MNKVLPFLGLVFMALQTPPAARTCLRVMPIEELTGDASLIARVKVLKVQKISSEEYSQLAMLSVVDVIEGDVTLKEVAVLAASNIPCAEDQYVKGQEMLVFLEPAGGLLRTRDLQYGQFQIDGETVKAWRDKANNPVDTSYSEAKKAINAFLDNAWTPHPVEGQPQSGSTQGQGADPSPDQQHKPKHPQKNP